MSPARIHFLSRDCADMVRLFAGGGLLAALACLGCVYLDAPYCSIAMGGFVFAFGLLASIAAYDHRALCNHRPTRIIMTAIEAMRIARDHRVTPSALHVLLVCIDDAPTYPSDIAERTGCTPAAITGMLDRLVRDGWVERSPDRRDRRCTFITPTERAFEVFTLCV